MTNPETSRRLDITAKWGAWIVDLTLAVLLAAFAYGLWMLVSDPDQTASDLAEALGATLTAERVSAPALWLAALFWCLTDIVGVMILLSARALFREYRHGRVFAPDATRRLSRIGALLVAMAPASVIGDMLAILALTSANAAGERQLTIGFDDTDLYAIVLGLIVVAAGIIMTEAVRLSEENKSFV